jgi:uncharacterized protein
MDEALARVRVGQHDLELLPEHAALMIEANTLLVADLHLGKAQTFQTFGLPIPSGHETRDLQRLANLVRKTRAARVVILGDVLHSRVGLRDNLVERIAASFLTLNAEVVLVGGNHDAGLERVAKAAGLIVHRELELDGLRLVHKPLERGPFVAGHVHPRVTLRLEGDLFKLPCFVLEREGLTLPAFSSFAAGANMPRRTGRQRFAVVGETVVALDDVRELEIS